MFFEWDVSLMISRDEESYIYLLFAHANKVKIVYHANQIIHPSSIAIFKDSPPMSGDMDV